MKHIVCIGGGTGMPLVLRALKDHDVYLSAIVTMADSGGSTGLLRAHYGTLPTGDVRRALAALSTTDSPLRDMMTYRFIGGPLDEQSAGSIFLTSLENVTGNFAQAIRTASELLKIRGEVIPVTLDNVQLCARLTDGTIIKGESNIDVPKHDGDTAIEEEWLEPAADGNPEAIRALLGADMIIIGPGDLYTSLIPNLLVNHISETIKQSGAKKVYLGNMMTKYGETTRFTATDFLKAIEKYVPIDIAVFNNKLPDPKIIDAYRISRSEFVKPPTQNPRYILADLLADGDLIRHDDKKLANVILSI